MGATEQQLPDGAKVTLVFVGGVWIGWLTYGDEKVAVENAATSRRAIASLVRQWATKEVMD